MWPYLIMAALYLTLAALAALSSALQGFDLIPFFSGLRWLRVHLITLGALSEALFGVLLAFATKRSGSRKPALGWDIWLAFNAGLAILMVGIPLINTVLIVTGGTLIFLATLMLIGAMRAPAPASNQTDRQNGAGRIFYLAGLAYLLLGIIVGSGLWLGWGKALRIANPIEVHIHTNTWGFMSLVLAGVAVDLYSRWTGRALAWPASVRPIFWLMALGALGSVLGPWLAINWFTALGIVLHQTATIWLLLNLIKPLRGTAIIRKPGIWHVITAYVWQVGVVLAAPLVAILQPNFSAAGIEQTAPQVLIYGWMLQYGYALIPYLLKRAVSPDQEAELGGSWLSLSAVHLGGIFLVASILVADLSAPLLGIVYLLWFVSLLPVVRQSWSILNSRSALTLSEIE